MIRNLKALGLAIVAVLAMSAVMASGASAATFHSSVEKTILTGNNTSHGPHVFKSGETQVSCTGATFTGTATGEAGTPTTNTTISVRPTYSGCTFLGEAASVDTVGCTYKFESHTSGGHLPTYVDCTSGGIIVTTGACNLTFGSQKTTGGTTATNLGSGSTADVTVHATAEATFTKSGPLCFLVAGNKGTYTGTATLQGFAEGSITGSLHENNYKVTEGAQVGISWS